MSANKTFGSTYGDISRMCGFDISPEVNYLANGKSPIYPYYIHSTNKTIVPCKDGYPQLNITYNLDGSISCLSYYTDNSFWISMDQNFCSGPIPEMLGRFKPGSSNKNNFSVKLMIFLIFTIWMLMSGL
ncbi:hypothetical protein BB558_002350 [Smittium angustum]|uniref:Uncharacterized protein n=1 Tax=Smittium angustum TaxID=133377 RepID=A0A2U1J8U5_SMIAN|nr:hypothetical protein BB558_002350 [Smittium angustum]